MNLPDQLALIRRLADRIGRPVRIMEVCGTHTMTAFRSGLRSVLPSNINLVSGPGCPVCVTPTSFVDRAISLCRLPDTAIATFGDMMRVPGTASSLEKEKAGGAEIRVVYSPEDALSEAVRKPQRSMILLGVGFETTAPAVAWAIRKAARENVKNFLVLCAHKTMPRAMRALLSETETRIDGFLCPGHVSAIIGTRAYRFIARDHNIPCVISGFEPADMIAAIEMLLGQLAESRAEVENQYTRGAGETGNKSALKLMSEVFEECDSEWRGLGTIPLSGLSMRKAFRKHDAGALCSDPVPPAPGSAAKCVCGDILRGVLAPPDCPIFGTECTPATPAGACMVSGEGACAAHYKYGRTSS